MLNAQQGTKAADDGGRGLHAVGRSRRAGVADLREMEGQEDDGDGQH